MQVPATGIPEENPGSQNNILHNDENQLKSRFAFHGTNNQDLLDG